MCEESFFFLFLSRPQREECYWFSHRLTGGGKAAQELSAGLENRKGRPSLGVGGLVCATTLSPPATGLKQLKRDYIRTTLNQPIWIQARSLRMHRDGCGALSQQFTFTFYSRLIAPWLSARLSSLYAPPPFPARFDSNRVPSLCRRIGT